MLTSSLAIATRGLDLPIKAALLRVPQLGAKGVMIDARNEVSARDFSESAQREFQRYLSELGLQVSAFYFPTRHNLADQRSLDERVNAIRKAILLASQLKVRNLLIEMGNVPEPIEESSLEDESDQGESPDADLLNPLAAFNFKLAPDKPYDEYQVLREVMLDLAQLGNHVGVTITVTPTGSLSRFGEFLEEIKTGPVGINFDPSVCVFNQQNPQELIRQFHDRLTHVVARDAVLERNGQNLEVPVGQGEVSWEEVLALLTEADYRGWISVQRTIGENRAIEMAQGIQYLQNIAMG